MTNQEAIERLQRCKRNLELGKIIGAVSEEDADERIEAYDLAIEALKENEKLSLLYSDMANEIARLKSMTGESGVDLRRGTINDR